MRVFRISALVLFLTISIDALPMSNFPTFEYEGAFDYFILSNSLLLDTADHSSYEPQGDTSIGVTGSSDTLLVTDIPKDAAIEKAFLVWFASVDDSDNMAFTDNVVTLTTPDGNEHEVAASLQGNTASPQGFEFESYFTSGYYYYVYRVDVTDIISDFQYDLDSGEMNSLVGEYNVKGVDDIYDCQLSGTSHAYCESASMIGGWQLILVYGSSEIARKRLYIYNGMDWSSNTKLNPTTVNISNFELPENAAVKISFVTSDGDDYAAAPESLELQGGLAPSAMVLGEIGNDSCNPLNQPFNSKFRKFNYKGMQSDCLQQLSFDVDTYFLQFDPEMPDSVINPHVQYGTNSMNFYIKTGADIVLTNYLILSVDTRLPAFDIPEKNEKFLLTPLEQGDKVCPETIFGYQIVVENHGHEPAENVIVKDVVMGLQDYIPGTFQIDTTGTGTCFVDFDDNGGFPLASGLTITEKMEICQDETNCDRILMRFLVKPGENAQKNTAFTNNAQIWDGKTGEAQAYRTNQGLAVRATFDNECEPMDETAVKNKLYTPESMACGGEVEQPDDETGDTGDTGDSGNTGNSGDTANSGSDSETSDNFIEDDVVGCSCNVVSL